MPDILIVLGDSAVGGEDTGAGGVHYCHVQPLVAVGIVGEVFSTFPEWKLR